MHSRLNGTSRIDYRCIGEMVLSVVRIEAVEGRDFMDGNRFYGAGDIVCVLNEEQRVKRKW